MFLKRLQSVGFKSFAERIDVEFVPGVTAVVGPNGSGKSNITDAIRWVLGEQSARSLRGSTMEDIIFQGSDTRSPLNVAEVTLVLDNTKQTLPLDYKEVSVTRRVFRSGESEFYINKQACRLKDIVELFMDSGLGREAFSIISQGKVEEILSSKAEERRIIFEEAAGVLKYKQRKKKSEFKLAETEENLHRVDDILHEIEQQISPLEEQSKKAENYLSLKKQLKEKEISFLITEIDDLHQEWQNLLKILEDEKNKEVICRDSIKQKEARMEQERQAIESLDGAIEELQAKLLKVTQDLEQYEGKKRLYDERHKHLEENKEKLQQQKAETKEATQKLKKELEFELNELESLKKQRRETNKATKKLELSLSTSKENILEKIEELKSIYIEHLNDQAANRNEKHSVEQQLEQLLRKKEGHKGKQQELQTSRNDLLVSHEQAVNDLNKFKENFADKQKRLEKLKRDLEDKRKTYHESQTKLYQGYQHIEKMKSRKEMLEEMKEDFQGFFQGVKAVLKARENQRLYHIHGAVLELIDIPKQFITAIETVLGGQAQHIVVSDEQAARSAIGYLKQARSGRATFLPLNTITSRFIPANVQENIRSHQGFIDIAADLVKVQPQYEHVVKHLMGHVIIARTLKDANEIARLANRRYRVVTLEGDVVNPGGSMSGGAKQQRNTSLFTREKDLQEVTEKLADYEQRADQFSENVKNQREDIDKMEKQIDELEGSIQQEQQEFQTKREHVTEINMRLKSLEENIDLYSREQQQFNQDETQLKHQRDQLTKYLENIEQELYSIQQQIDMLTVQEAEFNESKEKLQEKLQGHKVSLAEQIERLKHQQEKTSSLKQQLADSEAQHKKVASELDNLLEIEQSKESEETIEQHINDNTTAKQSVLNAIEQRRIERNERLQKVSKQEAELKENHQQHQALQESIQKKEVKTNRMDVDLENRLSQLQTDYEMTYERAIEVYEKCNHIEETKTAVESLKKEISDLGTVNLGAVDEYKRISERFNFLTIQKEDLVTAKQALYTAIAEMDEEMERLFTETFDQIREEFSIVFTELFGGGVAELKLTDPTNILHTGVDIVAQPPGKKLQNLSLLSGGERALTAIALLFSILRVRPVPFCILDEVEAALDEANVDRFAKYLRSHSEKTQFIVITHRKGTMEGADVLYGVTMQESGVSRLVSVRLEETEQLIES